MTYLSQMNRFESNFPAKFSFFLERLEILNLFRHREQLKRYCRGCFRDPCHLFNSLILTQYSALSLKFKKVHSPEKKGKKYLN